MKGSSRLREGRVPDKYRTRAHLHSPLDGARTVINHQRLCGLDSKISEDALVVFRSLFQCLDQIRAIEATETVAHPHRLQIASQIE